MKTFKQKKDQLKKLKDKIKKSKFTILTSFARIGEKGLNVGEMKELKNSLRSMDSEYSVEKKTLLDKALKLTGNKDVDIFSYQGSLGLVLSYGDEVSVAKSVYTFAKKKPTFKFFGAIWGNKFIDQSEVTELAKLPSRDVLIGRTVGMIKYPLSGLVNVLQANMRNLVLVLNQISISRQ